MCQEKVSILHGHQQILFFPHFHGLDHRHTLLTAVSHGICVFVLLLLSTLLQVKNFNIVKVYSIKMSNSLKKKKKKSSILVSLQDNEEFTVHS